MAIFRRKEDDEDEKRRAAQEAAEKAAQAEAKPAQEEKAPQADSAPDAAPAQAEASGAMEKTMAAAQKAQEQGFRRTQREYAKTVDTQLVRAGEMYLPENMEKHREILEKNNRAGMMGNGTTFGYAVNDIAVNVSSIKDERTLAYFASTLDSDWDKVTVYKAWAKENGRHVDDVLYDAEQLLGDRLFTRPQSNMGVLSGLRDANGSEININTARPEMVVQGIQGIADTEERKRAVNAFRSLCARKGTRFFGYYAPEDVDTFRDSYALTQAQYNALAKDYSGLFRQGTGEDVAAFNAEQYHMQLESIQGNDNYDALAKWNLTKALDKAYRGVTYEDKAPDKPKEKTPQPEQEVSAEKKGLLEQAGEVIGSAAEAVGRAFSGAGEFLFGKAPEDVQETAQEPEEAGEPATVQEPEPVQGPQRRTQAPAAQTEEPAPMPQDVSAAPDAAGPVQQEVRAEDQTVQEPEDGAAPMIQDGAPSVALFDQTARRGLETPGAAQVQAMQQYIPVADDGEVLALMYDGKGMQIAPKDRAHVDELMQDPNVRRLHGALNEQDKRALDVGNEPAEFITNRSMSAFGTTIYGAYQDVISDEFPKALRGDALMILTEVVYEAGRAYEQGMLTCPDGANSFEAYLDANPGKREKIQGIYDSWNALIENENRLRAENEQRSEQALADARTAVLSGQYSDAQLALVQENASADWEAVLDDETRAVMNAQMNRGYFYAGGGFEKTSVYRNMSARGVKDTGSYQASIKSEMQALLDEDTQTALSLGLTLEDYYERIGGMSLDQLAQRANLRMQQQGASITPEEKDVLTAAGDGVGMIPATGYGVALGAQSWWGTFNDSLYKGMTQANVIRTAEKMTGYYQSQFGPYGRDVYRADLTAMLGSGELSEAYAGALREAMDSAADIYDVGIDPQALGGLRRTAAQMRENVSQLDTYMAKNGTPGENRWYGYMGAITENAISAGVSTAVTAATGSAGLGFLAGYDVTGYGQRYDMRLAEGYSLSSASHMAAWDTAAMHLANSGTFEKVYGQLTGTTTLGRAGWMEAMRSNPSGAMKAKAAIGTFVRTAAGNVLDEAVADELKENLLGQAADRMFGPIYRKMDAGGEVTASDVLGAMLRVADVDPAQAVSDTLAGFADVAITSSLFALAGATVETARSVRMAKAIVSGKSDDIPGFLSAARADLSDAKTAAAIDDDARAQQQDEATVLTLMSDDGSDGKIKRHQKLQEQADSHRQERDASALRIEEGWAHYDEQKAAGNMQEAVNALEDVSKAEQGYKEHAREYEQKTYEADQAREEKLQDARRAAALRLAQDAEAMRTRMQQDGEQRRRTLDAEVAEMDTQLAAYEEQFVAASERGDEAEEDRLLRAYEQLAARRFELLESAQQSDAVQDARDQAEGALEAQDQAAAGAMEQAAESERLAEERAVMTPVYRDLRTRAVYVDAQQASEIRKMTGLTVPQFNRKYAMSLTTDRSKAHVSLDGSFFADLAAQAPGYIDAQTAHPEEALVKLAERKKELAGIQASLGHADAEAYVTETSYGTQDPMTQKIAGDLYKRTGIRLVTANIADGTRGWFDRANGQLVLSNRLGAGELRRTVAMHELTHFIEQSPGYAAYRDAVLKAAYMGDGQALERDRAELIEEYGRHGVNLSRSETDAELTAAATERVIGGDEVFFSQLIASGRGSLLARVYMKVRSFLARQKARKAGGEALARYDAIRQAHDLMDKALRQASRWTEGQTGSDRTAEISELTRDTDKRAGEQTQFAIRRDEAGKPVVVVEEDVLAGVPKKDWAKTVKQALKEKFPNGVTVGNNQIQITGKSRNEIVNAKDSQWLRNNQPDVYADKLRAANNADEIVQASSDYVNEGIFHERKDNIADFARGKVNIEVGGQMYSADVIVGTRKNGEMLLYDFVGMTKKETQRTAARQSAAHDSRAASLSDTIVPQESGGVKNQFMQSGVQKSIGIRQFGNNTMQRADFIEDRVKELVKDSEYERDTNREQVRRATERLDRDGLDATAAMLMNQERASYTAEDNALAFVAMADATRNGDSVTAAMLAMRMLEESTEQGRALQSLKIGLHLTPEGAMGEAIRKAKAYNAQRKNVDAGFIPVGSEAPKGKKSDSGERTKAAPYIQEVYDAAADLQERLSRLGGEASRDNPWGLPMNAVQMELARAYGLMGTALPGDYAHATTKQRMLCAIIATPDGVRGDGLLTLCQQLEFMKKGYAVVTEADLNYIAGQMSEAVLQGGDKSDIPKTREGQIALSRVYDAQANITPAGRMEKFRSYTYANMLSAPATWVRNVASNVLMDPLEQLSTGLASLADRAVAAKTGTRTTARATKDERAQANQAFRREIVNTFEDYFITHTDTGHGRKYDVNQAGRGRTFQNGMLEAGKTLVDFAMQVGDRPFYEKCYAEELAVIKRLGMKVSEGGALRDMTAEEMHAEATMRATKRVFQEDSAVSEAIGRLRQSPFWGTVADMVVPFVKTPTNIAARLLDYSPVGLARALLRDGLFDMKKDNGAGFDQRRFVMNLGRGLTGTGLTAAGCLLASAGVLRFGYGDEEDDRVRGVRKALVDPYGMYLQIGDTKHEISWALPGAGGLVIGANLMRNLAEATSDADVAEALTKGVLSSTWNEMFNSSMLAAFNDVFRGYGDATGIAERFIETSAGSFVSRLTPSWVRAVAKATDPYVRDTGDSSAVWSALKQNLVQSWPLMRQMLPIKTDLTGDRQLQSGYWNPAGEHGSAVMQMLDSFLTPTATIGEKNDAALCELLDLAYRTGESGFLPTELLSANKYELTVNKTQAKSLFRMDSSITLLLTDEEKRAVNAAYGDLLFGGDGGRHYRNAKGEIQKMDGLRSIMSGGRWERMTDEQRMELVESEVKKARELIICDMARRKKKEGEL